MSKTTGIRARHGRGCRSRDGGACNCRPSYEAFVYSARDGRKLRRTFPSLAEAKGWRHDAASAVRKGTMRTPTPTTLREAAEAFLEGAEAGTIKTRKGLPYRPSVVAGYRRVLNLRVLPDFGARRLGDLTRLDLQDLVDRLVADGLSPSTVHNAVMPVRVIYRRALRRGVVAVNPTTGLELPAVEGRRDRIATPQEAPKLLAALPDGDRALWATAMYAGLRRGELLALRWEDVDFAAGVIAVERAYDPDARQMVEPKSRAGRRKVPLPSTLRAYLRGHQLSTGRRTGLAFGRSATLPADPESVRTRAIKAWAAAGIPGIGLHECRHTFASFMIAAGVNAKALSTYMGHASITITLDRYGHLMPGNEDEAAGLLDDYLERATGAQTGAQRG